MSAHSVTGLGPADIVVICMFIPVLVLALTTKRRVYFKARCPCCSKELIVDGECVRRPHLEDQET